MILSALRRSSRAAKRWILELSVLDVSVLRRDAAENCLSHKVFSFHHLVNLANDRVGLFLWDDNYAVDIGEDKVTRPDRDALDLNRFSKRLDSPGSSDVTWRLEPRKHREFQLSDKSIIAAPAVDDVTSDSAQMQSLRGELAHEREVVIMRLTNNDMTLRGIAQEFSPAHHTLVNGAVRVGPSLHCEYTPRHTRFGIKGSNPVRKYAVFEAEFAHHIVHSASVTFPKPV